MKTHVLICTCSMIYLMFKLLYFRFLCLIIVHLLVVLLYTCMYAWTFTARRFILLFGS